MISLDNECFGNDLGCVELMLYFTRGAVATEINPKCFSFWGTWSLRPPLPPLSSRSAYGPTYPSHFSTDKIQFTTSWKKAVLLCLISCIFRKPLKTCCGLQSKNLNFCISRFFILQKKRLNFLISHRLIVAMSE